jgi:hypothetical protein
MDQARIKADVPVNLEVPLNLQIPINLATDVTITRDTPIDNAPVKIFTGIITINGPADIVIPAGTVLPIQLNVTVPYQQTLKYSTSVTVDIPLFDTSLRTPFVNLQDVVSPISGRLPARASIGRILPSANRCAPSAPGGSNKGVDIFVG